MGKQRLSWSYQVPDLLTVSPELVERPVPRRRQQRWRQGPLLRELLRPSPASLTPVLSAAMSSPSRCSRTMPLPMHLGLTSTLRKPLWRKEDYIMGSTGLPEQFTTCLAARRKEATASNLQVLGP